MKTLIHVSKDRIAANAKDGGSRPVYTIRQGDLIRYAREVVINGPSTLVYGRGKLDGGATCWIETEASLTTIDETDEPLAA